MAAEEELFHIELEGIEREYAIEANGQTQGTYVVAFSCHRPGHAINAEITLEVASVATLEVIPLAMAELHRAFVDLFRQSEAWTKQA